MITIGINQLKLSGADLGLNFGGGGGGGTDDVGGVISRCGQLSLHGLKIFLGGGRPPQAPRPPLDLLLNYIHVVLWQALNSVNITNTIHGPYRDNFLPDKNLTLYSTHAVQKKVTIIHNQITIMNHK